MLTAPFEVIAPPAGVRPTPFVVHVPHAATFVPADVRAALRLSDAELEGELRRMTDHHTDVLAGRVGHLGATRFVNRWSRLAVDPERFDDPDLEEMEAVGMGAIYTRTSERAPLRTLTPAQRHELMERHFRPYHAAFSALVDDLLATHGTCTILDVHSYASVALPYELHPDEPRPQLCIGTDPVHTPQVLRHRVLAAAAAHDLRAAFDRPFGGTFVPTGHLGDDRVRSVMLEFRRDTYLDEATARLHGGVTRVTDLVADLSTDLITGLNR